MRRSPLVVGLLLVLAWADGPLVEDAVARDGCTRYVAPDGSAANSGRSREFPWPLSLARRKTRPGFVVCLLPGEYALRRTLYIGRSGRSGERVVFRSKGGTAHLRWTGSSAEDVVQITRGTHHIVVRGLAIDGQNASATGLKVSAGAHHVVIVGNEISRTGSSGVGTKVADFIRVHRNRIHHVGYNPRKGWGSGVSLNSHVWKGTARGFHSFVTNNIISGVVDASDHHSDGNGIIMDLGGDTPPVLIANNLVYENGGRCIHNKLVRNIWVVNNTCYMNGLDTRIRATGEFTNSDARSIHLINNVAYAWTGRFPYKVGAGSSVDFIRNSAFGGRTSQVPLRVQQNPKRLRIANPRFVDAPTLDPTASGQYADAIPPDAVGRRFHLERRSSLIDAGINPRNLGGVPRALRIEMSRVLIRDLAGARRPQGAAFDLGAYDRAR